MKFGVRDICDVVFKAKDNMMIGRKRFYKGQPVLYIDTATASTLEQATTTVYAQGGKGNTRLIAWEGEKTLTFTVTDALISPIGLAILSGAGLFKEEEKGHSSVHVHATATANFGKNGVAAPNLGENEKIDTEAPIFCVEMDGSGDLTGKMFDITAATEKSVTIDVDDVFEEGEDGVKTCFIDFYMVKDAAGVSEIDITAESFGGNFYVEASTLFRDKNGIDHPAEITLPNVKIQSNFTFSMSATGDPSTFDFVMDAMPDYTMFDKTTKVMCVIQTIDEAGAAAAGAQNPVMLHETKDDAALDASQQDAYDGNDGVPQAWLKDANSFADDPADKIWGRPVSVEEEPGEDDKNKI